jgi:histone-lysine N-methyltransferase SETMAR
MFKKGQTNVTEAERSAGPQHQPAMRNWKLVLEDRKDTITATAQNLNVGHRSVYEVVYDSLGLHKVCARWVPRQLKRKHKLSCMDISSCHLKYYHNEQENFLKSIIIEDKALIHHYKPESKQQSMQWK